MRILINTKMCKLQFTLKLVPGPFETFTAWQINQIFWYLHPKDIWNGAILTQLKIDCDQIGRHIAGKMIDVCQKYYISIDTIMPVIWYCMWKKKTLKNWTECLKYISSESVAVSRKYIYIKWDDKSNYAKNLYHTR